MHFFAFVLHIVLKLYLKKSFLKRVECISMRIVVSLFIDNIYLCALRPQAFFAKLELQNAKKSFKCIAFLFVLKVLKAIYKDKKFY
jgi:hypothetical protein